VYAEMRLAGARRTKSDDIGEDDAPSTSGRQCLEGADGDLLHVDVPKILVLFIYLLGCAIHWSISPSTYEPTFDWENERALIFGQRIP
ncbi:hypothetical protein LR48_Vigan04g213100, partial [Vigna angularis]